jgi:hypothetical protein
VLVPPAVKVPQLMELRGWVHALSEYTPKFAEVNTVPAEAKLVDVLMAEKVVTDKASPIMTNAIIAVIIESLRFAVIISRTNTLLRMQRFNPKTQKHACLFINFIFFTTAGFASFLKFMERNVFLKLFIFIIFSLSPSIFKPCYRLHLYYDFLKNQLTNANCQL